MLQAIAISCIYKQAIIRKCLSKHICLDQLLLVRSLFHTNIVCKTLLLDIFVVSQGKGASSLLKSSKPVDFFTFSDGLNVDFPLVKLTTVNVEDRNLTIQFRRQPDLGPLQIQQKQSNYFKKMSFWGTNIVERDINTRVYLFQNGNNRFEEPINSHRLHLLQK